MRRMSLLVAVPVVVLVSGSLTGCATKKFVGGRVDEVNTKVSARVDQVNSRVDDLSTSLDATEAETKKNGARIAEVDQTATGASDAARTAAAAAAKTDERVSKIEQDSKRLLFEVVLSEEEGQFAFGKATLPASVEAEIDALVKQLASYPKGVFVEVEGHTDSVGPKSVNDRLGLERAEAVKRYLYETHQVPLHKISVISYGEDKPVASNDTREGRAQNRRVVIKVLM